TTSFTVPYTSIAIAEAILASFLHLYNFPETRRLLLPDGTDLYHLIAPFTGVYSSLHASTAAARDNQYDGELVAADHRPPGGGGDEQPYPQLEAAKETTRQQHRGGGGGGGIRPPLQPPQSYANFEQRTLCYLACKNALISILRSWSG